MDFPLLAYISPDTIIPIVAIGGGLIVGAIAIVFGTLRSILQIKSREETKREMAAYVAEGSISPEDAERILKADMPTRERGRCGAKRG